MPFLNGGGSIDVMITDMKCWLNCCLFLKGALPLRGCTQMQMRAHTECQVPGVRDGGRAPDPEASFTLLPLPLPARSFHGPCPFTGSSVSISAGGDFLPSHEAKGCYHTLSSRCSKNWWGYLQDCKSWWRIASLLNCHSRTLKTTFSVTIIPFSKKEKDSLYIEYIYDLGCCFLLICCKPLTYTWTSCP